VGSDFIATGTPPRSWGFNPRPPSGERRVSDTSQYADVLVSIHAPRVGSDSQGGTITLTLKTFQSTPPEWGATADVSKSRSTFRVSIHAPRVGSDPSPVQLLGQSPVSIHAPRVGSDKRAGHFTKRSRVSIHAPRVGSDRRSAKSTGWTVEFQSTPPVWGAT